MVDGVFLVMIGVGWWGVVVEVGWFVELCYLVLDLVGVVYYVGVGLVGV